MPADRRDAPGIVDVEGERVSLVASRSARDRRHTDRRGSRRRTLTYRYVCEKGESAQASCGVKCGGRMSGIL